MLLQDLPAIVDKLQSYNSYKYPEGTYVRVVDPEETMGEKLVAEVLADGVAINSGPQVHFVGHAIPTLVCVLATSDINLGQFQNHDFHVPGRHERRTPTPCRLLCTAKEEAEKDDKCARLDHIGLREFVPPCELRDMPSCHRSVSFRLFDIAPPVTLSRWKLKGQWGGAVVSLKSAQGPRHLGARKSVWCC
ncbi:hypothetical protein E2C01_000105 [Portunus trituberculatus]|uniref:Uncharacterized protein n=1 Tax=Portunus trituberculatus TaxID=210409 RepID=A0A5B7CIS0_PORTR|nr:hypothetical protein [Portunus trituberculatus]